MNSIRFHDALDKRIYEVLADKLNSEYCSGEQNYLVLHSDSTLIFTQEEVYKLLVIMAHTTEFEIINKLEKMLASDKELSDNDFNKVEFVTDNVPDLKALVGSIEIKVSI